MEYHLNIRRNDSNHIKNNGDDILIEIWIRVSWSYQMVFGGIDKKKYFGANL